MNKKTRLKSLWCISVLALLAGLTSIGLAAHHDPIGWWKLDDSTGTTAVDSSGNGYDGAVGGDATWATGQYGGALAFHGAGWVEVPPEVWNDNIFDGFSVCFWEYTDDADQQSVSVTSKVGNNPRNLMPASKVCPVSFAEL